MKNLIFITILLLSTASAQLSTKGEFELSTSFTSSSFNDNWSDQFRLTLRGHLEADYDLSPASFRVVLDPTIL